MTCIVGIETPHGVALASDSGSFGTNGGVTVTLSPEDAKIFRGGKDFVVGVAGSARLTNVLQYCVKWPSAPVHISTKEPFSSPALLSWLVRLLVPMLRVACKREGLDFSREEDNDGDSKGDMGPVLFGVGGCLYTLEEDWAVERAVCGYNAIGIGAPVAMGALYAHHHKPPFQSVRTTLDILRESLDAAAAHSPFVREPWVYMVPETEIKLSTPLKNLREVARPKKKVEHRLRTKKVK